MLLLSYKIKSGRKMEQRKRGNKDMKCKICGNERAIPIENQILCEKHIIEYQQRIEEVYRKNIRLKYKHDPLTGGLIEKMYLDPSSFCRKCSNLWVKDRYCTRCGEKKKNE